MPPVTSIQHCTGDPSQDNKARQKHKDQEEKTKSSERTEKLLE